MTDYNVPVLSLASAPNADDMIKFNGTNFVPVAGVESRILILESEMSQALDGVSSEASQASVQSQVASRVLVLESEMSAVEAGGGWPNGPSLASCHSATSDLLTAVDSQLLLLESEVSAISAAGGGAGTAGGGTAVLLGWNYDSVTQGTWAATVSDVHLYNGYFGNSASSADGDEIHYSTFLGAGTYTLKLLGTKASNHGIVDIYIDAGEVASFDLYNATVARNQVLTQTSISVASAGVKDIKVILDGKNGSSSDYIIAFQSITFYRTA